MNWKVPAPNKAARENFSKFIESGGGMVMVHFACGAWQDWPGFVKIAGRVYNPKFRGHDPRGPFTIEIVNKDHPITKGMKDFETYDELYTCLDGKTPIDILAHAKSKVDKKHHPMGFVLKFGKGRVFHSPLGHDVRAFEAAGVQELFRRGAAWAGKLKPVPAGK
jgi:type 1 glutamine amidotransferase